MTSEITNYIDATTGIKVSFPPHCDANLEAVRDTSTKVSNYLASIDPSQLTVCREKGFQVHEVTMFGPNVGFVYGTTHITDAKTGKFVPGAVLVTGASVGVLLVFDVDGEYHIVLTDQQRAATGGRQKEIPAGMADEEGDLSGVALKEVEEETNTKIPNTKCLIDLGQYWTSQGRTSEFVKLFAYVKSMTKIDYDNMVQAKKDKTFGTPNEAIQLEFRVLDDDIEQYGDAKLEIAVTRFLRRVR
jgi:8-oxo-dGTP pyrophosphatase MutT (NUDIX family)